jgi:hypothetical protein
MFISITTLASSVVQGFSYSMHYIKLIYKTILSYIFVNNSSDMLPLLVCQYLTRLLECRSYLEPKAKRAKPSGTLREALIPPYCGQRHYIAIQALSLNEIVSGC